MAGHYDPRVTAYFTWVFFSGMQGGGAKDAAATGGGDGFVPKFVPQE
jgi:hypothetical protein